MRFDCGTARRVLSVLFVLTTLTAIGITVGRLSYAWSQARGPEKAVGEFLQAALEGDVEAAMGMVDSPVDEAPLIASEVTASGWSIGDVQLIAPIQPSVNAEPEFAQVQATIHGPEETSLTADLKVANNGGGWKVLDPFGWVRVDRALVPFLEVNGFKIDLNDFDNPNTMLAVLPGLYEFFSEPISLIKPSHEPIMFLGNQLIEIGASAQRTSGKTHPFSYSFEARDGIEELIEQRVSDHIDWCIASAGTEPGIDCPFIPIALDVQPVDSFNEHYVDAAWTVIEYPVPVLAVTDEKLNEDSLLLTFRQEGVMEAVAHSEAYTDLYYNTTVEYESEREIYFHCPLWIYGLQLQIESDGDFTIVRSENEAALQTWTKIRTHDCTSY
jgi:hypothetical protein